MYLCVRGYQAMTDLFVVMYLCVRGYQAMTESGHVFVC